MTRKYFFLTFVLAGIWLGAVPSAWAQTNYSGADKVLMPAKGWDCGRAEGIQVPERGTPVLEADLTLDQVYSIGRTPYGWRDVFVIGGGTVTGEKIKGSVMKGGLDFQLSFSNGAMEVEEVMVLKTEDGKYIYVRSPGTAVDRSDVRMAPVFEAPNSSGFAWLNTGKYVARRTADVAAKTMKITVFDATALAVDGKDAMTVTKPADVMDQPWSFREARREEKRGDLLITENVTLSPSQGVGATGKGRRNVIPITGGTLTGKITGKVLSGGADYQSLGNPMTLDARYLWQTSDGEVIIVRNGGPIASLAPGFEVRTDSKYAWLNQGNYLSSGPAMGAGGVSLTFYQSAP